MNRTLKEATVRRYHYETHDQLREHLGTFLVAYNFAMPDWLASHPVCGSNGRPPMKRISWSRAVAKKQAEYRACPVCKIQFRLSRSWKVYCSPKCAKKAKRERDASGISSVIPVPSYSPPFSEAKNGAGQAINDGQTPKKCLPKEGDVAPKSKRYESLLVRGPNGRVWGLHPSRITAEMLEAEGIKKMPLLALAKAMCLDCRGDQDEVNVCARPSCPMYRYRGGTNPWERENA